MDEMKSIEKIAGLDHIDHFIIKAMADKNCPPEEIATRLGKVDKKNPLKNTLKMFHNITQILQDYFFDFHCTFYKNYIFGRSSETAKAHRG
eukprot:TRINITY_DN4444_c0_g1_i1.p1 TRINITY_DN4444_c0_g1~~TRINITY_DN4444_c0_g1_i1.p1  ORF type:complete len:91 (-),score=23.36 TRINITY_DN4444_c0_g1_i1:2-274(-)